VRQGQGQGEREKTGGDVTAEGGYRGRRVGTGKGGGQKREGAEGKGRDISPHGHF